MRRGKNRTAALLLVCLSIVWSAVATAQPSIREEYSQFFNKSSQVLAMDEDSFGEVYDPYSGSTYFQATDISLPGTGAVAVELGRLLRVDAGRYIGAKEQFGTWEIDLPYMYGIFADMEGGGWNVGSGLRCSGPTSSGGSQPDAPNSPFGARDYWQGNFLHIPGQGDQGVLFATSDSRLPRAVGHSYKFITKSHWFFTCLPTMKRGAGEGFVAVSPEGTRYFFDWMLEYPTIGVTKPGMAPNATILLKRKEVRIYPTKIEDRFGNWVTLDWSERNLARIIAKDGRSISLAYGADGKIDNATDGSRTWTYNYDASRIALQSVTSPDSSTWTYQGQGLSSFNYYDNTTTIKYSHGPCDFSGCSQGYVMDEMMMCSWMRKFKSVDSHMIITAPSGGVATFRFAPMRRGRTEVRSICIDPAIEGYNPYTAYNLYPVFFDGLALSRKEINNFGEVAAWTYTYSAPEGSYDGISEAGYFYGAQTGTSSTTIGFPGVSRRLVFGNRYEVNEGLLLEEAISGTGVYRSTVHRYYDATVDGEPAFPPIAGDTGQQISSNFSSKHLPIVATSISLSGDSFDTTNSGFDMFARSTRVFKASSLGYSKLDTVEYHDDLSKWVIGQVRKTLTNGVVVSETGFDSATVLPAWTRSFGKLQGSTTFYGDGNVATVTNGRNFTTTLSNWYRGIPRTVNYPDGTSQSAVVDPRGWITSVTDESGFKTCYSYDSMGRRTTITYPSETELGVCDTSAWTPMLQEFAKINVAEWGIPAGHWRQTTSVGNGRQEIYFDGLLQPVLSRKFDANAPTATTSFSRRDFDKRGREVFTSYPGNTHSLSAGTWTLYDALDRVTSSTQDSEQGLLTTRTEYLGDLRTRTTNARGFVTTVYHQAWDTPVYDMPVKIDAPEGSTTMIARDAWGKPLQITRDGAAL